MAFRGRSGLDSRNARPQTRARAAFALLALPYSAAAVATISYPADHSKIVVTLEPDDALGTALTFHSIFDDYDIEHDRGFNALPSDCTDNDGAPGAQWMSLDLRAGPADDGCDRQLHAGDGDRRLRRRRPRGLVPDDRLDAGPVGRTTTSSPAGRRRHLELRHAATLGGHRGHTEILLVRLLRIRVADPVVLGGDVDRRQLDPRLRRRAAGGRPAAVRQASCTRGCRSPIRAAIADEARIRLPIASPPARDGATAPLGGAAAARSASSRARGCGVARASVLTLTRGAWASNAPS